MTDRVVVAIPWRPTAERLLGFHYVAEWWARYFPRFDLVHVDTDHEPYNLSAARNLGVRRAESIGADVVVISDADAIPADPRVIAHAIDAAVDGRLHLPFTRQRYLTAEETEGVLGGRGAPLEGSHGNGALYVVTPSTYWRVGGSDERFSGWGGDDDGLVAAALVFAGVERHDGTVWSLHHADERRPIGTPEHAPNADLAARYWACVGHPSKMRRLIRERDYPGAVTTVAGEALAS